MRGREIEPFGAIDLRECLHLPASRWPLDLEHITPDSMHIEIAFDGERDHALSGTLADLAQRLKRLIKDDAGLLGKFTTGHGDCILFPVHLALRDRPRAL